MGASVSVVLSVEQSRQVNCMLVPICTGDMPTRSIPHAYARMGMYGIKNPTHKRARDCVREGISRTQALLAGGGFSY